MPVYPAATVLPTDPGALIVADFQYQFGAFLFGSQTSYITTKVDGLLSLAPTRSTGDIDYTNDHGSSPGILTLGKRVIAFDMAALGLAGTDIEEKMAAARAAFQIPRIRNSRVMTPFVYKRPGEPKKLIMARCVRRDISSTYEVAHGKADASVQLEATDPRIYSLTPAQQIVTLGPAVTTGSVTAHNAGDLSDGSLPVIAITGPWTNPRITNAADDGRTIRIDIALTSTDVLLIDVQQRTVQVSHAGGAYVNAFGNLRSDNQWWAVLPGNNLITATRTSGNSGATGTMTVQWQDVYS